jgi:hypothetical protein
MCVCCGVGVSYQAGDDFSGERAEAFAKHLVRTELCIHFESININSIDDGSKFQAGRHLNDFLGRWTVLQDCPLEQLLPLIRDAQVACFAKRTLSLYLTLVERWNATQAMFRGLYKEDGFNKGQTYPPVRIEHLFRVMGAALRRWVRAQVSRINVWRGQFSAVKQAIQV